MPTFMSRSLTALFYGASALIAVASYQGHADSVMSGGVTCLRAREAEASIAKETDIDVPHIFCGAVSKSGRSSGYHHRYKGKDAQTARLDEIISENKATGVYVGRGVEIWDGGSWVRKKGISSFFPDTCSIEQVLRSIDHASRNIQCRYRNGKWSGQSAPASSKGNGQYCLGNDGSVLTVQGYFERRTQNEVATAWPLTGPPKGNCIAGN